MILSLPWRFQNRHLSRPVCFIVMNYKSLSGEEPVFCHSLSVQRSRYMEISQAYYEKMKDCASIRSVIVSRKLHAQLIFTGLDSSTFLRNHLIRVYSSCGLIDDAFRVFSEIQFRNVFSWNMIISGSAELGRMREADKLFDEMPERDSVSWNAMMAGYFQNGRPEDTVNVFILMNCESGCVPNQFSFCCAMKACASLGDAKLASQLHSLIEKFSFCEDASVHSSIMDMYIKCGSLYLAEQVFLRISNPTLFCSNSMIYGYSKLYGVARALDFFYQMPEHDDVSWNTMISIMSQRGFGVQTHAMFVEMWSNGIRPYSMTIASVLSACAHTYDLDWGAHLHARIIRMESNLDAYLGGGLIDMYAKCGRLEYAKQVFSSLTEHNVVPWTSLIRGLAQLGHVEDALTLFKEMKEVPLALDQYALATVLGVCSDHTGVLLGEQLQADVIKIGMDTCVSVGNSIITMYAKCGNVQTANHAFQLMPIRDIISWTAMITAFSESKNIEKAREYFDKMPERNVISWNSMLATYTQHGFFEDGLRLYVLMLRKGFKPDCITFSTSLSACAYLGLLNLGNQIISQAEKFGLNSSVSVKNSVVTMYSRCGRILEAQKVFDSIVTKNLISWNSMMAGYAQNGQGSKVVDIFDKMVNMGIMPDHISYLSVFSGCSHSGLVSEGQHYFDMMIKDHGIPVTFEHIACIVDLLGRAGFLEQAKILIDEMPLESSASAWGSLLRACQIHGNAKLAELVVKNLNELDVDESACYALLANIYSDSSRIEGVSEVRRYMRDKAIRKNPGCSWIEVNNRVHVFTVDDTSHPQIKDVYKMLSEIMKTILNPNQPIIYLKHHCRALHNQHHRVVFDQEIWE